MPRLVGLVIAIVIIAVVAVLRPRLPALWIARVWRLAKRSALAPGRDDPSWVIYYLGNLPGEIIPPDARALEDWVRTVGVVLLAIPAFLLLALFVLAP